MISCLRVSSINMNTAVASEKWLRSFNCEIMNWKTDVKCLRLNSKEVSWWMTFKAIQSNCWRRTNMKKSFSDKGMQVLESAWEVRWRHQRKWDSPLFRIWVWRHKCGQRFLNWQSRISKRLKNWKFKSVKWIEAWRLPAELEAPSLANPLLTKTSSINSKVRCAKNAVRWDMVTPSSTRLRCCKRRKIQSMQTSQRMNKRTHYFHILNSTSNWTLTENLLNSASTKISMLQQHDSRKLWTSILENNLNMLIST